MEVKEKYSLEDKNKIQAEFIQRELKEKEEDCRKRYDKVRTIYEYWKDTICTTNGLLSDSEFILNKYELEFLRKLMNRSSISQLTTHQPTHAKGEWLLDIKFGPPIEKKIRKLEDRLERARKLAKTGDSNRDWYKYYRVPITGSDSDEEYREEELKKQTGANKKN